MLTQLARSSSSSGDKDRCQGPVEEREGVISQEQAALVVQVQRGEQEEEPQDEGDLGVVSRGVLPEEEWEVSVAEA